MISKAISRHESSVAYFFPPPLWLKVRKAVACLHRSLSKQSDHIPVWGESLWLSQLSLYLLWQIGPGERYLSPWEGQVAVTRCSHVRTELTSLEYVLRTERERMNVANWLQRGKKSIIFHKDFSSTQVLLRNAYTFTHTNTYTSHPHASLI